MQGVNAPLGMGVDFQAPEYYHYNLTIERELGRDLALEAGYVGSKGRHLGRRYNRNQPIPFANSDGTTGSTRPFPAFADIQYQDQTIESSVRRLADVAAAALFGRADDARVVHAG